MTALSRAYSSRSHPIRIGLLACGVMAAACAPGPPSPEARSCQPACEVVTFSGTLHVVRNGTARYFLVEESGASMELQNAEAAAARHGGLLALDRRHVTVSGWRVAPDTLAVTSMEPGTTP